MGEFEQPFDWGADGRPGCQADPGMPPEGAQSAPKPSRFNDLPQGRGLKWNSRRSGRPHDDKLVQEPAEASACTNTDSQTARRVVPRDRGLQEKGSGPQLSVVKLQLSMPPKSV
jgi:hypothetical protein